MCLMTVLVRQMTKTQNKETQIYLISITLVQNNQELMTLLSILKRPWPFKTKHSNRNKLKTKIKKNLSLRVLATIF